MKPKTLNINDKPAMPNSYFQFKQFTIQQDRSAMKVTTDACLFGAWTSVNSVESLVGGREKILNALDIGTGTGLLSMMLAQQFPGVMIDAIEIDEDSFSQAKENISVSLFSDRIHVVHGDARFFPFKKKYDLIISNPPFYENELRSADSGRNIAQHDHALLLGELMQIIKTNLSPGGFFYLLLPYKRNEEVEKLFKEFHLQKTCFVRQSVNHDYFRIMISGKLKTRTETETMIEEIAITDDRQQYTKEFTDLLGDYYLHL